MPRTSMADVLAAVTALAAEVATLKAAASAPAAAVVSGHVGPSGRPDGRRFPCTVEPGVCTKLTRSPEAAATHDSTAPRYHARAV